METKHIGTLNAVAQIDVNKSKCSSASLFSMSKIPLARTANNRSFSFLGFGAPENKTPSPSTITYGEFRYPLSMISKSVITFANAASCASFLIFACFDPVDSL